MANFRGAVNEFIDTRQEKQYLQSTIRVMIDEAGFQSPPKHLRVHVRGMEDREREDELQVVHEPEGTHESEVVRGLALEVQVDQEQMEEEERI